MRKLDDAHWAETADLVCGILNECSANRRLFQKEAQKRKISVESLVAAAVTEMIRKRIEARDD